MDIDDTFNKNIPFILFVGVYFGFQIFSQIYNYNLSIPASRNSIQNFIAALVLYGLVIYYGNPKLNITKYSVICFIVSFVVVFVYSAAKRGLDEMSEKDKRLGADSKMKGLILMSLWVYGILAIVYLFNYIRKAENSYEMGKIVATSILIILLVIGFYKFKGSPDDENNIALGLYLFPLLFLTKGLQDGGFMSYIYLILYTSVAALWGFFGVEWFTGKKDYEGLSTKTCKAFLGISDSQLSSQLSEETESKVNSRNINFIYMAVGLIFVSFIIALIFFFISFQRLSGNM